MKENNKFSLSAFFCSLGSKSKIFMFFLLGVPFFLVQIFTLKVYANSAVVPVVPEGLTTSGITSNGIVPGDPSLLYYTVLIALGLKADEVYQVNKADIVDSTIESLNEFDSVNDPTLGNDLQTYLEWVDNAKAQNGYINELSVPRELWDRLNKATSTGLNIRIQNPGSSVMPTITGDYVANLFISRGFDISQNSYLMNGCSTVAEKANNGGCLIYINAENSGEWATQLVLGGEYDYDDGTRYWFQNWTIVEINNSVSRGNVRSGTATQIPHARTITWYYKDFVSEVGSSSKHLGVSRPFITSKANNTYDVLSKSGVINDTTGDLEGDVTMSVLSPDRLKDIASDYEDVATDIPVFFPDSRLVPIDIENPNEIPDSVGIPGDTPQEIIDSLADTIDPSPAEPIVIQPFNYIDQWDPFIPDPTPETPLVGLSAVMNWLAEQMQTTMYLTQFSNCWLVLSTLVVAACLIGLVRIWR